jgi:hypothetical protein
MSAMPTSAPALDADASPARRASWPRRLLGLLGADAMLALGTTMCAVLVVAVLLGPLLGLADPPADRDLLAGRELPVRWTVRKSAHSPSSSGGQS